MKILHWVVALAALAAVIVLFLPTYIFKKLLTHSVRVLVTAGAEILGEIEVE